MDVTYQPSRLNSPVTLFTFALATNPMDEEFERRSKISFLQAENLSPLPVQLALLKLNKAIRIKLERLILLLLEANVYERSEYYVEWYVSHDFREFLADYFELYIDEAPKLRDDAKTYISKIR